VIRGTQSKGSLKDQEVKTALLPKNAKINKFGSKAFLFEGIVILNFKNFKIF